jgi:hypothetical protein
MNITGPANKILLDSIEKDISRQSQLRVIEDAVAEIINHPLTPSLDEGAQVRFKNIIVRHLARLL